MHHVLAELYAIIRPFLGVAVILVVGMVLRRRGYLRDPESATTRAFTALESTAYTMVASRIGPVRDMKSQGAWTPEEAARVRSEVEALVRSVAAPHLRSVPDPDAVVRAVVEAAVEKHRAGEVPPAQPTR